MKIEEFQFPSDWNIGPIARWFDFTTKPRGLDLSKNGDQIPFFPMDQIPLGRIRVSEFTPKLLAQLGSGTYVENGDLMVAKITPSFENGKQAIVDIERDFAYATTEVIPMRGRSGESDTLFLFFYLLHPEVRSDLAGKMEGSTGRQRLSKTVLGDRLIPLPPLPEQKKIAHILSTVQRAIEAQERIIQTTTELKKALMHKLFTEGLRNEPQKQTEIGPVPESWDVVPFDKFVTLQRGYDLRKQDFRKGDVPVIGATQVIGYHDTANVKAPGVTVVRSGSSAGKPLFIAEDFWAHNVLLYVKDFQGNMPKFVYYKILALDLTQYRQGVAVPTLNRNTFSAIELALPSAGEQQEIADVLDAVGNKTEIAERKRDQLQDIFRTLLHELMTAKTRVHELELTA